VCVYVPDLTLEIWIRRTQEMRNPRETILSIDSEEHSLPLALSWFLTPDGLVLPEFPSFLSLSLSLSRTRARTHTHMCVCVCVCVCVRVSVFVCA